MNYIDWNTINSILIIAMLVCFASIILSFMLLYKAYTLQDKKMIQNKTVDTLLSLIVFLFINTLNEFVQDYHAKKADLIEVLIEIFLSRLILYVIGILSLVLVKNYKEDFFYQVIQSLTEDHDKSEKYILVRKRAIFTSLFGRTILREEQMLAIVASFNSIEEAAKALEEAQR